MNETIFCTHCGNKLEPEARFCPSCGTKTKAETIHSKTIHGSPKPVPISRKKSGTTALLLCIFMGMLGAHRFYVGKYWTGLLMLCTGGLMGVWVVIDLTSIARNKFSDKNENELELIHNITPVKETLIVMGSVMLWVALFFAAIALFVNYSSSGLVTIVNNQLTALQKGQMEQAYSYTTQSYQKNNSINAFKNFVYSYPVLFNNTGANFPTRRMVGNNGYVSGILTGKDGAKIPISYQLIKENGQWKIINIQVSITPIISNSPPQ
ncbi:DUF4864 domain-containing protein [Legionella fallonii]|uniref:TM2 domain containing protein n=1 Tax=Legionella fallonii LLAP-10 TaxID=1212491 RepID=A0A098G7J4_9GAMM